MARQYKRFSEREAQQIERWAAKNGATVRRVPIEGSGSGGGCCLRQLARGKRKLATRLAQRWVKLQLGIAARDGWAY